MPTAGHLVGKRISKFNCTGNSLLSDQRYWLPFNSIQISTFHFKIQKKNLHSHMSKKERKIAALNLED